MNKNILKISALVVMIGAAAGASLLVKSKLDDVDESTENDVKIESVKKTLPEGVTMFSESGTSTPPMWEVTAADGSKLYLQVDKRNLLNKIKALVPQPHPKTTQEVKYVKRKQ